MARLPNYPTNAELKEKVMGELKEMTDVSLLTGPVSQLIDQAVVVVMCNLMNLSENASFYHLSAIFNERSDVLAKEIAKNIKTLAMLV